MKRLFTFAFAAFSAAAAFAQTDGFVVDDVNIAPGQEKQIQISLNNANAETAFQFDLALPTGVTIVKDGDDYKVSYAGRNAADHVIKVGEVDGKYRFLGYSNTNANLTGNSGALLNVTIAAAADAEAETATASISDGLIVDSDANSNTEEIKGDFAVNVSDLPASMPIKIGSTGKSTYCCNYNLDFTGSDVAAYVMSGFDSTNGIFWLTRVNNVPAGTAVFVKGPEGTTDVPVVAESSSCYKNFLVGNASATDKLPVTSDGKGTYYFYGTQGFSPFTSREIGTNKAYAYIPALADAKVGDTHKVTISETAQRTTLCVDKDLDFSEVDGLKAYIVSGYDKDSEIIWLTRVQSVSAGTPVYLRATGGNYEVPSVAVQSNYASMLVGNNSDAAITINGTDGEYTNLFCGTQGWSAIDGSKSIGAHKSYLQIPTSYFVKASSTRGIGDAIYNTVEAEVIYESVVGGDGTTGISTLRQNDEGETDVIYNLNGQRVENPRKGLYIKNGRKVVIK